MRLILKISAGLVVLALFCQAAWAASFTATLDRDSMVVGDQATFSLAFEGGQPRNVPAPDVPGLEFSQTGTAQSVNIDNGQMTATVTVNFTVTARQPGDYTIPAFNANINGQQLSTQPIKLTVTRPSAPSSSDVNAGNEVAFLKLVLPNRRVYIGEPLVGQLDLYLRDDVQQSGNFQLTAMPINGFTSGKITDLQNMRRTERLGNHRYSVIPLAVPLSAVKTGPVQIGPISASIVVVLPTQDQSGDPFFRSFFNQGQQKQVSMTTDAANLEALPLPDKDKPANFTGAVGNFTMTATAGPTTVTVGDPITVHVQISGNGNMDNLVLPTQDAWQNFKTYPPTSKLETSDQYGFQGTKTFEQIISPENADVHEVPPVSFSFFNPEDGQYHTLTQPAVPLQVTSAGATPLPAIVAAKTSAPESQLPQDVLPIKENLGAFEPASTPLVAQPAFLALQSVPLILFGAALFWRKREENLANNPRLRRRRAVAQLIASGLVDLKKFAAANQPDEFFALLFRLLQEQLGERLDCPASAITSLGADARMASLGANPATVQELHELFQLCDQARYAPVRGVSELNSLARRFEKALKELQELKA